MCANQLFVLEGLTYNEAKRTFWWVSKNFMLSEKKWATDIYTFIRLFIYKLHSGPVWNDKGNVKKIKICTRTLGACCNANEWNEADMLVRAVCCAWPTSQEISTK